MNETVRYGLPLLVPGQAQKELFHNEALARLDAFLSPAVNGAATAPPTSPTDGEAWRVLAAPTGAWAQHPQEIATWTAGAWTFQRPQPGYIVWDRATGTHIVFDGASWRTGAWPVRAVEVSGKQVLGARRPAIAGPTGGAVVDSEARAAIQALLAMARAHGFIEA